MSNVQESLVRIRKVVADWADFHFEEPVNESMGVGQYIIENHLPDIRRIRWYTMHSELHAESLWLKYVKDSRIEGELHQSVFDFYVSGTTYMLTHCYIEATERQALLDHIAKSVKWMEGSPYVPSEIKQYAEESAKLDSFIRDNPLMLFIFILSGLKI